MSHQGLGDHILCAGIYREYAKKYNLCVVPVTQKNYKTVCEMLKDVSNIKILRYQSEIWNLKMLANRNYLKRFSFDFLNLGTYGSSFFDDPLKKIDANFYDQANLPLETRWTSFYFDRNLVQEEKLFNLLECNKGDYIFVHEDPSRGFLLQPDLLPPGIRIVRPNLKLIGRYSFFDYLKVIENASQIHCIESSFAALIESFQISVPKFAHRYARPEAALDPRYEFTYKSEWTILL
jgi:hypothetical protein